MGGGPLFSSAASVNKYSGGTPPLGTVDTFPWTIMLLGVYGIVSTLISLRIDLKINIRIFQLGLYSFFIATQSQSTLFNTYTEEPDFPLPQQSKST